MQWANYTYSLHCRLQAPKFIYFGYLHVVWKLPQKNLVIIYWLWYASTKTFILLVECFSWGTFAEFTLGLPQTVTVIQKLKQSYIYNCIPLVSPAMQKKLLYLLNVYHLKTLISIKFLHSSQFVMRLILEVYHYWLLAGCVYCGIPGKIMERKDLRNYKSADCQSHDYSNYKTPTIFCTNWFSKPVAMR